MQAFQPKIVYRSKEKALRNHPRKRSCGAGRGANGARFTVWGTEYGLVRLRALRARRFQPVLILAEYR